MPEKYTLEEIKDNLENLYEKLRSKGREEGFWVIASRSDFKPIKIEETIKGKKVSKTIVSINDIKSDVLEGKEQYFKDKKLAAIHFSFVPALLNSKEYKQENYEKIKDESIASVVIDIYVIDKEGKIKSKSYNQWRCIINFTVDDLTKHKLKFSDAEMLMRQVAEKLVRTVDFYGIDFKDYVKVLKKNIKKLKNKD